MKKNNKLIFGILYSLIIVICSMGGSLLVSTILFGRNGINTKMVDVNNLLMGTLGVIIIILLTKRYYQKYAPKKIKQVDFLKTKRFKSILLGFFIGLMTVSSLLICQLLLGDKMFFQGFKLNNFSFLSGIMTFVGMAALEECIFRGILCQAFDCWGKTVANLTPIFLFVAMHMDLWQAFDLLRVIDLVTAGLFFTLILHKTDSLLLVTVTHAIYNISSVMIFGLGSDTGLFKTTTQASLLSLNGEQTSTLISIIIMTLTMCLTLIITKNSQKKILINDIC